MIGIIRATTVMAALLLGACTGSTDQVRTKVGDAHLETVTTLAELVRRSDVIVAGTVTGTGEIWNMARGRDPSTPSQTNIVLAQNFEVKVDRVVKGADRDRIIVAVAKARGIVGVGQADDPEWLPPAIGARYLWFLVRIPGTDVYGQPGEPYRFRLTTEARVESRWAGALANYPRSSTITFLEQVRAIAERP